MGLRELTRRGNVGRMPALMSETTNRSSASWPAKATPKGRWRMEWMGMSGCDGIPETMGVPQAIAYRERCWRWWGDCGKWGLNSRTVLPR